MQKACILIAVLLSFIGTAHAIVLHEQPAFAPNSIHAQAIGADQTVRLTKIHLADHSEVYTLSKFHITIVNAGEDFAQALVNDKEISELRTAGYHVEILIEDYQAYVDEIFQRGFYHTYDQTYLVLDSFVTDYPDICRLDTIGYSVLGRAIWAMRVTDNPQIEENEPEIRLKGNIHGDEHIGTEITLYFLRHLLTNYATNPHVQNLVDNSEFWVLPTLNPDGKVANTRRNANNVDLNRDYGYFWDGWSGSPSPCSQIETKVLVQHLEENNTSLEFDYHSYIGDTSWVYYSWDYHPADPPDSQHIISIAQVYADSANYNFGNGYDWYQICGSSGDYPIGISGALSYATENPRYVSSLEIDSICYEHRDALIDVCERAGWGIEGVVKDSITNTPLYARIEFMNPDRVDIYTDPNLGDFHKMIEQGTYDLRISANGYAPKVINNVNVPATGSVSTGDILLAPDSSYLYAFRPVLCRYAAHAQYGIQTRPRHALGAEDNIFFSLGRTGLNGGYVVLDMGPNSLIANGSGDDFTVYEGDDGTPEGYEVFASNDWEGPWISCGIDTGTASFDLSTAGLSRARYIKVLDDRSAASGQYAGFDLDAIKFFSATGIEEDEEFTIHNTRYNLMVSPNPFRYNTQIRFMIQDTRYTIEEITLKIYDATGRLVRSFRPTPDALRSTQISWDGVDDANRKLPSGVYFLKLQAGDYSATEKLLLIK